MPLPLTYTNRVSNPSATPSGQGAALRTNLITNPDMYPATALTVVRQNLEGQPSFEPPFTISGSWNVPPEASASIVTTTGGVTTGNRCVAVSSSPTSSSNDTYIGVGNAGSRMLSGIIADGETFTISADITIPQAQTGTIHPRARRIVIFTKNSSTGTYTEYLSNQAPNSPGTYRVSVTGTCATGSGVSLFWRFYNGSPVDSEEVYWDSVVIQRASTIAGAGATYFDGSTPFRASIDGDRTSSWSGTPNQSVSNESVRGVTGYTVSASAWARSSTVNPLTGVDGVDGRNMSFGFSGSAAIGAAVVQTTATLPAATQHTFSAYVYVPSGAPRVRLRASGPGMTAATTALTTAYDAWVRLSVTFTTVTAGVYTLSLENGDAVTSASPSLLTEAWQLETGGTATGWFSGESSAANLSYAWSGVAGASTSQESGLGINGYTGDNANVICAEVDGAFRMGIVPSGASMASRAFVDGGTGAIRMGVTPGRAYWVRARAHQTAALMGGAGSVVRCMSFFTVAGTTQETRSAAHTNAAGTYIHEFLVHIPVGATEAYLALNHGYATGSGTLWWDQVVVTEAEYETVEAYAGGSSYDSTAWAAVGATISQTTQSSVRYITMIGSAQTSYMKWLGPVVGSGTLPFDIQPGRTYTLTHTIRTGVAAQSAPAADARRAVILMTTPAGTTTVKSTQIANGVGAVATYTTTFTTPADLTNIEFQFWHGNSGDTIHYTNIMLKDTTLTDYTPNYFDGDTSPVTDATRVTRWLDTPNASQSQYVFRGLVVEPMANVSPPRAQFYVGGLGLTKTTRVQIRRKAGDDTMVVAGWSSKGVLDSSYGVDWQPPLNTPVEYQMWVENVLVDADTITINSPCGWISDPLVPGNALPIYTVENGDALQLQSGAMANKSYDIDVDKSTIIGSPLPMARVSQRQHLATLDLSVQSPSTVTTLAFYDIIKGASILCVRTHPSWGNVPPVIYLAANVTEEPINVQWGGQFTKFGIKGDAVQPVTRGPVVTTVTHAQVQAALTGRTHQSILNVSSSKRWIDIQSDPLSMGE